MTEILTAPYTSQTYEPTSRILELRDRALSQQPDAFLYWHRPYRYLEAWMAADTLPLPMRHAEGFASFLRQTPIRVYPGELIVGDHGNGGDLCNLRALFPREYAKCIRKECDLPEEQKKQLLKWVAKQPFDWMHLAPVAPHPPELQKAQEHGVVAVWGTDLNHSIRAYEKVLRLGFDGIRQDIETSLENLPVTDPDAALRRANLLGWLRICDAAKSLGRRHAALAREQIAQTDDPELQREWLEIAAVCDQVPAHPARTFREAVQALWFAHMITVWEDAVNANGIGRIDQFLWPYLKKDLEEERITWEGAAELLSALWIKLYQAYDVQQMMIGGQLSDGSDATNPLSYLVLDVTEGLGFVRCLSARLHSQSPRQFVSRCVDLIARGGGIPFFFNDEALVPALVGKGIPPEEARGYAAIGCIEITIPGKANPHAVSHWINLPKCLELALNDGCDLLDGTQLGPRTGTVAEFCSMEEVLNAYTTQLTYFTELAVYGSNSAELAHRSQFRLPYLSLLTEDCIARGLDIIEGGARYNYHSSAAMGIPNVADSLAALASTVFSTNGNKVTGEQMLRALREDFAGQEELCNFLRYRVPKYGNDDPLPDTYAGELTKQYCELLGKYRTVSGGTFHCHLFTFTLMLGYGKLTGASPEGRRAGEPLAYSLSPVQGRDREGLTAVLNSLSRIPHHLAAASSSAILEADPTLLEGAGRQAFADLILAAVNMGVGQMQINVVNADTLRAAQEDPERYRNLCVRVSGFSQQFCLLNREMQDHIIARTKHRK